MSGRRIYFLDEAHRELLTAFEWYAERSQRSAGAFLREVDRAAKLIAQSPDVWPQFEGDIRRYVLHKYPYSILYRQVDVTIQIIAVAHHKRRPGYWRGRPDV